MIASSLLHVSFGGALKTTQKSRRCYHRIISGLESGGQFRFLTLTSSNQSPDLCQKNWRILYMRLKRRGLVQGYIKVPELSKNGKQHLHVIIRGKYIAQAYLSEQWQEIHKAKVVGITRVHQGSNKGHLASYLVKYMAKENIFRYSWSWDWVWKGFCRDWWNLKRTWSYWNDMAEPVSFTVLLKIWRIFLRSRSPTKLRLLLAKIAPEAYLSKENSPEAMPALNLQESLGIA